MCPTTYTAPTLRSPSYQRQKTHLPEPLRAITPLLFCSTCKTIRDVKSRFSNYKHPQEKRQDDGMAQKDRAYSSKRVYWLDSERQTVQPSDYYTEHSTRPNVRVNKKKTTEEARVHFKLQSLSADLSEGAKRLVVCNHRCSSVQHDCIASAHTKMAQWLEKIGAKEIYSALSCTALTTESTAVKEQARNMNMDQDSYASYAAAVTIQSQTDSADPSWNNVAQLSSTTTAIRRLTGNGIFRGKPCITKLIPCTKSSKVYTRTVRHGICGAATRWYKNKTGAAASRKEDANSTVKFVSDDELSRCPNNQAGNLDSHRCYKTTAGHNKVHIYHVYIKSEHGNIPIIYGREIILRQLEQKRQLRHVANAAPKQLPKIGGMRGLNKMAVNPMNTAPEQNTDPDSEQWCTETQPIPMQSVRIDVRLKQRIQLLSAHIRPWPPAYAKTISTRLGRTTQRIVKYHKITSHSTASPNTWAAQLDTYRHIYQNSVLITTEENVRLLIPIETSHAAEVGPYT